MGSTSDLPVMDKAAKLLDELEIPFEINALSAHRTPAEVETFAREAKDRGLRVIIAAAGMAAALPGVIARHWSAHQGYARRLGRSPLHRTNASWHPRGYCRCQRCSQRCSFGGADDSPF